MSAAGGAGGREEDSNTPLETDGDENEIVGDDEISVSLTDVDEPLAAAFAAVDAAIAQADRTLASERASQTKHTTERNSLVYDLDWDEGVRLDEWRAVVDKVRALTPDPGSGDRGGGLGRDRTPAALAVARPPACS